MTAKIFCAGLLLLASPALSAETDPQALRDLCPDRPGKGTSACTVDRGHFQIEIDAFDISLQRQHGLTTDTTIVASPTIKYGVSDHWDVEATLVPFERVRSRDRQPGITDAASGFGDLYLRAKYAAAIAGTNQFSFGFEPFLKIPTASKAIGNGAVEGGVVVPLGLDLGGGWSFSATPEIDALQNENERGAHIALTNVLGLSRTVAPGFTFTIEGWNASDFDPAGTTRQYSVDFAASWQPDGQPDLQLDAGVNVGLTSATPDLQVYLGLTRRI
jgi:hypothetical protein